MKNKESKAVETISMRLLITPTTMYYTIPQAERVPREKQ